MSGLPSPAMPLKLVLTAQLFNHTCFRGSKVLLTLYALELGASPVVAGLLFAMYSVLPAFLSIYAGRVADGIGHRRPMLLGTCGLVAGLTLPFLWPSLVALFFSATIAGTCYIFYTVSIQSLVGSLGEGNERTRNYSLYALSASVTALTGPLIAGFGLEHLGGGATYLLLAALPLVTVLLLLSVRTPERRPPSGRASAAHRGAPGALLRHPPLRRILVMAGIVETGNELGNFLLPIYGTAVGLSPSQIGIVMAMLAIASFVVRAFVPRLSARAGEETVLAGCLAVAACACLALPFTERFVFVAAAAFGYGLGIGGGAPLSMSLVFGRSPQGRSGEAMGVRQMVNKGTEMVVPLVFGGVSTAFGMLPVFALVAALLGAGAVLMQRDARER